MKIYHYILIIGGLHITLNVLYPPMIYENWTINGRNKTTRQFFTTTKIDTGEPIIEKVEKVGNTTVTRRNITTYDVQLNAPRLVTQNFMILGIMCISLGFTIPKDEVTPPKT